MVDKQLRAHKDESEGVNAAGKRPDAPGIPGDMSVYYKSAGDEAEEKRKQQSGQIGGGCAVRLKRRSC